MPLSKITFQKGEGGLGRPLPGQDHISGILLYAGSLPAGFGADREKTVYSLAEAVALGIVEGSATFGILHYHIEEYFRVQPLGVLHIGIYAVPVGSYTFSEVNTLQLYALGAIRQVAVYTALTGVVPAEVLALHTACLALATAHMPLIALLAVDISAVASIASLPDLRTGKSDYYVSVVIGQDGDAKGAALYDSEAQSITCLGAILGAISKSSVHESIGWVKKFNLLTGTELSTVAFANGQLFNAIAASALDTLYDKGYLFLMKHIGISGTYAVGAPTATAATSDYAYQESNRTIDKAIRNVRTYLLPEIGGPVQVDATTGRLTLDNIEHLKSIGDDALGQMDRDGELSGFQTVINPEQDVLSTGVIEITIEQVPVGVARSFTVNIGFTTQLSA